MARHLTISTALAVALAGCGGAGIPSSVVREQRTPGSVAAFFDCLRERSLTVVMAHRGGDSPVENALSALQRTVRGAPGPVILEVEVRRARDGAIVLLSDDRLDRITTGSGPVSALSGRDIERLKLKNSVGETLDENPTTLEDALEYAEGRAIVAVSASAALADAWLSVVRDERAEAGVIAVAATTADAIKLHRTAPSIMIAAPISSIEALEALEANGVALTRIIAVTKSRQPDPALNRALAARGVEVAFGAFGDGADALDVRASETGDQGYSSASDTGVHVIWTDRPLEAMRALNDADGEGSAVKACLTAATTR